MSVCVVLHWGEMDVFNKIPKTSLNIWLQSILKIYSYIVRTLPSNILSCMDTAGILIELRGLVEP